MVRGGDPARIRAVRDHVRSLADAGLVRITQHAQQAMVEDDVILDALLTALRDPSLLEDYPEHTRGACCLVLVRLDNGKPLHVVYTTSLTILVIVTVYEPKQPKWSSPTRRSRFE